MNKNKVLIIVAVGVLLAGGVYAALNTYLLSRTHVLSGVRAADGAGAFVAVNGPSQDVSNYKGVGTVTYMLAADELSSEVNFEAVLKLQHSNDAMSYADVAGHEVTISGIAEQSDVATIAIPFQTVRRYVRGRIEAVNAYNVYGGMTLGYGIMIDGHQGR